MTTIRAVLGEPISFRTAAVMIEGRIYKADPTNANHIGKFAGVTMQSGSRGVIDLMTEGQIQWQGPPLNPDARYYIGLNGQLSEQPLANGAVWSKCIGYAQDQNTLIILPAETYGRLQ